MMGEDEPRRVVVVEDSADMRKGLRALLKPHTAVTIVGEAHTAEDAIALISELVPDIAIFDIKIPLRPGGKDETDHGIAAIRQVAAISPHTRILVRSFLDDSSTVAQAFAAGAHGYISKGDPYNGRDLVDAMIRIIRGERMLSPGVAPHIQAFFSQLTASRTAERDNPADQPATDQSLTRREREVLDRLVLRETNAEIADALVIAETTVKTHVSNILTKFQLKTRQQIIDREQRRRNG